MTGKEAIVEKILADARAIANSTLEEAGKRGSEIIGVAQSDAKIYREKNMAESYTEREEIIRRRMTVGNLEVKKLLLKKRQDIMTQAFDGALKAIKADVKGYLKLLDGMLANAEDGDTVFLSESDRDLVGEKWLLGKANEKKLDISFGGYGGFSGGMIIAGKGSDKNLSLDVELKTVREEYEPEIAGILFGD